MDGTDHDCRLKLHTRNSLPKSRNSNLRLTQPKTECQLKVAEEESQARLRFRQQVARLMHQSQFEEEQLKLTLRNTAEDEQQKGAELKDRKRRIIQVEVTEAQETHAKATKILDQALKEIGLKNDEIENLALERSATYRNCRLEDIKLPLLEGHLKNVPMEENFRKEVAMDVDDDDGTQRPRQVQDLHLYTILARLSSLLPRSHLNTSPNTVTPSCSRPDALMDLLS